VFARALLWISLGDPGVPARRVGGDRGMDSATRCCRAMVESGGNSVELGVEVVGVVAATIPGDRRRSRGSCGLTMR
jgi:hypothetical protein